MKLSILKPVLLFVTRNLQIIHTDPKTIGQNWRRYEIGPLPVNTQLRPNQQIPKNLFTIELQNIVISFQSQLYCIYMNKTKTTVYRN